MVAEYDRVYLRQKAEGDVCMLHTSYLQESKRLIATALPLVAAQLVQGSSGFVSTLMLAKLGPDELAACGLVSFWYFTILVLFWGMLGGTSVLTAHAYGAKKQETIKKVICQGMVFAIFLTIPMLFSIHLAVWLIKQLSLKPSVIQLAIQYLHGMACSIIPGTYLVLFEQFLIGISKSRAVMFFSLISVPLTIVISYPLIFGKFGLPQVGIAGVGYGTALAYTIVIVWMLLYITRYKPFRRFLTAKRLFKIDTQLFKDFLRLGWPIGMISGIDVGFFAVLAYLMGQISSIALAAHQIVLQFIGLVIMVAFGFMNATTVLVGQAIGRQEFGQVRLIGNVGIGVGTLVTILIGIAYALSAKHLVAMDIDIHNPQNLPLLNLTVHLMFIAIIYQVANSIRLISQGALRGLKDTKIPMVINLVAFWLVAFPVSYYLGALERFNAPGLWWGIALGMGVGAAVVLWRFQILAVTSLETRR